jgi:hypothetical protein
MHSLRRAHTCLAAGCAALLTACAATIATKDVGPCSPSYTISKSGVGRASAQQLGRGAPIAWGIYVDQEYKFGTHFTVAVYAAGRKIDGKDQYYEPHGSISAQRALAYSGKLLEISGKGVHGDDTLVFDLKCNIA